MNYLISIDWLDGCWKTILGKRLAERIDWRYYYTPPEQIHSIREFADKSTPHIRGYYYMFGNLVASKDFEEILKHSHVVSDRYIYATRAYHEVLWVNLLTPKNLLLPHAVVYIKASWETMQRRLKERFWTSPYEDINYLKKVAIHYEEMLSIVPNVIVVDSTDRNPDDVIEEILDKLSFLQF